MDKDYEQLIHKAKGNYDSFSLVWRDQLDFNANSTKFEEALKQYLIKEFHTDEWPGTKIFGSKAKVRTYKVNSGSLALLSQLNNVFEFMSPNYPEDLAFYSKGQVKFASVAHEKDAWYEGT
jgi:hypothetical protein